MLIMYYSCYVEHEDLADDFVLILLLNRFDILFLQVENDAIVALSLRKGYDLS